MQQPEPTRPRTTFWSLLRMAVITLVLLMAGLVVSIISGTIGGVIAITAVFAFAAFHYVIWGWWLSSRLRDERDGQASAQSPQDKNSPG